MNENGEDKLAVKWGEDLAHLLSLRFGNDLRFVLQALNIQLAIMPRDQSEFPFPRYAVWEGDRRVIRLFQRPLLQKLSDWNFAARRACAHELLHALSADRYRLLPLVVPPPALSSRAEEYAAEAFAEVVARNFRLTLEDRVLNFSQ
ncbi:MAG: hypothetical protein ACREOO_29965 [bacterium]